MTVSQPSNTRRRRQCGPKTRTGCLTCKIRRVKCDEEKPHCRRCTSTGRKCDGYSQDVLALDASDPMSGTLIQRISTHIPGTAPERRGFSFFMNHTSPELNGFYSTGFWEYLILQASYSEPSLRHTVIAIGSLHEKFSQKLLGKSPEQEKQEMEFALNQYTKAIGHLRRSLATGKQAPMTALMSCILFVCFDSLRGHYDSAMLHLQSGLKILRDLKVRTAQEDHLIETTIAPLFMRLSVQSILYVDTRPPGDRQEFARDLMRVSSREKDIPEAFENLEEARMSLNDAADGLFRMFYLCDGSLPMSLQPEEAYGIFEKYDARLGCWNKSFEKFMNNKSVGFTSKQVRGAALLKIHHTTATIMSQATPSPHDPRVLAECVNSPDFFKKHTEGFQIIINLCRSVIAAADQDARNGKPTLTFSTDLGLIAPLYYTSVKAATRSQRLEALELLKRCPRREGMWDSGTTINLITEFWDIEARHKAMQQGYVSEISGPIAQRIPMHEVVDLIFHDGGRWEWVWKDFRNTSPLNTLLSRTSTPDDCSLWSNADISSDSSSESYGYNSY
ncbi:hypothetical protein BGZ60DRAFT_382778 [Tricladium varicosporioides]|nr:hypothetical protein BGZ60DRAFT_382778 [Hymenoscyphus varicosporioides]